MQAVEAVGISTADEVTGHDVERDAENDQCAQLAAAQPYVAEVRSQGGGIELRQRAIENAGGKIQWVIVPPREPAHPDGWRLETNIKALNFDSPLESLLSPGDNYLVSTPLEPANSFEIEQRLSFMLMFGPRSGTYRWHEKSYEYRVTQKLPCFPLERR